MIALANEQTGPRRRLLVYRSDRVLDEFASDALVLSPLLDYLSPGDFVALSSDGQIVQVIWRHESSQNFMLLTERCDNYCLMCSQPPKDQEDDYLLGQAFELVEQLSGDTEAFTLTGGEPTLYGSELLRLLGLCRDRLPKTHLQLLTNGRRFADPEFAAAYATAVGDHMIACIPLYGAEPQRHDYVVQANGAFDETVRGILNLARLEQRIELRVVLHKQTAPVLGDIAEFISRNLPFVERVALMGLEITGLTRLNLDELWIDPFDYRDVLADAVSTLDNAGVSTLLYNHQLCLLDPSVRRHAVKSISDWKNEYLPVCGKCNARGSCGGFFASARYRRSDHIVPIRT